MLQVDKTQPETSFKFRQHNQIYTKKIQLTTKSRKHKKYIQIQRKVEVEYLSVVLENVFISINPLNYIFLYMFIYIYIYIIFHQ